MAELLNRSPVETDEFLVELEQAAVNMAWEAGKMLTSHFSGPITVEYKDERQSDPVTDADRESQSFLINKIKESFPEHSVIGEEDIDVSDEPVSEFAWVLDPLDGTRNFSQGLPIFACSIGIMQRGKPVVGAIFIPWPGTDGVVLHAHSGGGAFKDGLRSTSFDRRLHIPAASLPDARRLIGLPGGFSYGFRFDEPMKGKVGETRQIGSIAYELSMTATGVYQYSALTGSLSIWDVAAGSIIVQEAGGQVLIGGSKSEPISWRPLRAFSDEWETNPPSPSELHSWHKPMLFGSPNVVKSVASAIRPRRRLSRQVSRWLR